MGNRHVRFFIFSRIILIYLVTILFSGCATVPSTPEFHVAVDSISSQDAMSKRRYILLPGLDNTELTDLQFKEYAAYVEKALASKLFVKANNLEDANVVIFLVYGIGNPQEHSFTYSLPIWGQTGVSSSTTFGTLNTLGSTATYSGFTTYTPTYGIKGFMPFSGSYVTFFRYLMLDAIDLDKYKESQKIIPLWRTTVTSTGSSGDLRQVFPILVTASKPYIGTNTGKKITIVITEDDQRVVEIKGIK